MNGGTGGNGETGGTAGLAGTGGSNGAVGGSSGAAGDASGGGGGGTGGAAGAVGEGGAGADGGAAGEDGAGGCPNETLATSYEVHPVDVVWVIQNAASVQEAIDEINAGLHDFATQLAARDLDYHLIVLSRRGTSSGSVCIPPPLAGDANCGNGSRFFQSNVNISSTQLLEQFLGTLGQTTGYQPGDSRGGDPWAQWLRADSTKSIVAVTDDNARFSADQFETFPGGMNPFNSTLLPPGILDPSYGGSFAGYRFDAMYGWGSDQDPSVECQFVGGTTPASAGPTYTDLVARTGGVRAKLCDGASAWPSFFQAVAQSVALSARIDCTIALPTPPLGTDVVRAIELVNGGDVTELAPVASASACASGGFYLPAPGSATLCPISCDLARSVVGPARAGEIRVVHGCSLG